MLQKIFITVLNNTYTHIWAFSPEPTSIYSPLRSCGPTAISAWISEAQGTWNTLSGTRPYCMILKATQALQEYCIASSSTIARGILLSKQSLLSAPLPNVECCFQLQQDRDRLLYHEAFFKVYFFTLINFATATEIKLKVDFY